MDRKANPLPMENWKLSQVQSILGKQDVTAEDIARVEAERDVALRASHAAPRPKRPWWHNWLAVFAMVAVVGCSQPGDVPNTPAIDGVYVQHIATINLHGLYRIVDTEQGVVCYQIRSGIECMVAKDGGR